jgi:hypothetical protein
MMAALKLHDGQSLSAADLAKSMVFPVITVAKVPYLIKQTAFVQPWANARPLASTTLVR